jgi:putative nucleotidyltransferase with HDIG domain
MRSNLSEIAVEQGLRKVPPFPPIAARLLVLLSGESPSLSAAADLINGDPTFSARLLNSVNSAAYGVTSRVVNIQQALALLGMDRVRQLTLTVAVGAYAEGALRSNELRRCWEHTMATAILSDQIARACGGAFNDIAYTAGIMHDIGRLGLLVGYPAEYERIIRDAAAQCVDLLDFEREQFGMDHAEAGRILAERWNLPEEFRVIAGRHHDPCGGEGVDLLRIVHVACRLADAVGFDVSKPLTPLQVDEVLDDLPSGARARLSMTPEEMRAKIEDRLRTFDGGDDADVAPEPPPAVIALEEQPAEEPQFVVDLGKTAASGPRVPLTWIAVAAILLLIGLSAVFLSR